MNTMRMALFCALVGWMAADAQAQLGTYGSPDPIPMGQYGPQYSSMPVVVNRTSYVAATDSAGPTLSPPPYGNIPQPPGPYGNVPQQLPAASGGAVPSSESSAVSSMLCEPNPAVGPSSGCAVLPSGGYMKHAVNGETSGDVCGGFCGNGCCPSWYASADALYMTRNTPTRVYTSAEENAVANQGYFNEHNWTPGEQATIGYRFGCNCDWALEGTYWGLSESCSDGGPCIPGPYVSPMTFGLVNMLGTVGNSGTGCQTANNYTDNSPCHHVWLNYMAQDLELNLVRNLYGGPCGGQLSGQGCGQCGGCGQGCGQCSPFGVDFMLGVRWFRFQDGFVFGAERANDGTPYANDWLYLNDRVTNDLVGVQMGFNANYRFADCWKAFITPKFGIYDNHMTLDYNLYSVSCTTGQQYQGCSSTYANPNYPVHTTADGFAFLTQVDLGLDWQICRHVSTQFGYRVCAMTGMALSGSQIPSYANDTQAIACIAHNDSLILHGAFGGLTFTW